MKRIILTFALALLPLVHWSCGASGNVPVMPDEEEKPSVVAEFALGADISWVTELEAAGDKFYNFDGEEMECTALMKELGLNAIRLRVWVDPSRHGNWCDAEDLVVKAKRAAALDMDVMVDFHYSDWWADPGKQYKPESWKELGLAELKEAVASHTTDVLKALKDASVRPKWVQVGNEIRPGMLWDEDAALSGASYDIRANDVSDAGTSSPAVLYPANWDNLAEFINVGYDAVKKVFPEAEVIVHLDNGYDQGLYTWFFDALKEHGGRWDIVGMSLYPYWRNHNGSNASAETTITECIANINMVAGRYSCPVMVVETGMECADDNGNLASATVLQAGYEQLSMIIRQCKENTYGKCLGVFYWEPECRPSRYRLGAFTEEGRPTVIMKAFGEN